MLIFGDTLPTIQNVSKSLDVPDDVVLLMPSGAGGYKSHPRGVQGNIQGWGCDLGPFACRHYTVSPFSPFFGPDKLDF